ncbi:hypothetical protein OG413_18380 [Streptomyces sp. NBC_01433]|uniref:hypothetical protein n=1 Tax=Streptomyces sp. NBC_01433 TaxID=2903864 RepID=UPI00224F4820|nr:hypothetical protein [Streptomyces sp. NBC_01433]MCX4677244.1 hypothetical protein [Streptomyces sp. NBC_01433]
MKTLGQALISVGAAATLLFGISTSAHAAQGVFYYGKQQGFVVLENPQNGRCYNLGESKGLINYTDATAVVYDRGGCRDEVDAFPPGEEQGRTEFSSVKFVTE